MDVISTFLAALIIFHAAKSRESELFEALEMSPQMRKGRVEMVVPASH